MSIAVEQRRIISFALMAGVLAWMPGYQAQEIAGEWYLDAIHATRLPASLIAKKSNPVKPIIVAVVDDGLRFSHHSVRDFVWRNPNEIPDNGIDDDANGYVDDVHGWDVADQDANIMPPPYRLDEYYHGTHVSSIIARVVQRTLGTSHTVKIMGVKAVADEAPHVYVNAGYEGIAYAIAAGADVILCAFSSSQITSAQKALLQRAHDLGIVVVGSAGNYYNLTPMYPAAYPTVIAVAATGPDLKISGQTNVAPWVDISAPGENIQAAITTADSAQAIHSGTSQAAAMVAAAVAILKQSSPTMTPTLLEAHLKNTSVSLDSHNPKLTGYSGAGQVNIAQAIESLASPLYATIYRNSQGYVELSGQNGATRTTIKPHGVFEGIQIDRAGDLSTNVGTLRLYAGPSRDHKLVAEHSLSALPRRFYVTGNVAHIEITGAPEAFTLPLSFRARGINHRTQYCSSVTRLTEPGSWEDGSAKSTYASFSDCKWLITAPKGKVIRIKFSEFDTQAKTDLLYLFNGDKTSQTIMAIFSGPDLPPELTTWSNQVLIWFVSDGEIEGNGFRGEFEFLDSRQED